MANTTLHLAVLIDADNTSPKIADALFEEIAKIGHATIRRIYGDFSNSRLKKWADILPNHAIIAHQQFANTVGKNATDIALVIDAMDILHGGLVNGICLVSSDSDFTRLASRIREQGIPVIGFGEQKTPKSFIQACESFIYTENLIPQPVKSPAVNTPPKTIKQISSSIPLIKKAIDQIADENGWALMGPTGSQLKILYPDFDQRNYGFAKLSDLLKATNTFEFKNPNDIQIFIRFNAKPGKKPANA